MEILVAGLAVAVVYSFLSLRVLQQYERGVAFFLGTLLGHQGPRASSSFPPASRVRSGCRSGSWRSTSRRRT